MWGGIGKTSHSETGAELKARLKREEAERNRIAQQQYNLICNMMGRMCDFTLIGCYFWLEKEDETRGICYNSVTGASTPFNVSLEYSTLDIWDNGRFICYGKGFFDAYLEHINNKIDKSVEDILEQT